MKRLFILVALSPILLLAGCASTTSAPHPNVSQITPTATPTPSPMPTPDLKVYAGNGYSISYPQGWKVTPSSNGIAFDDTTNNGYSLSITINPNPSGSVDVSTFANMIIEAGKSLLKNPQTETLPLTTTVGGDSWVQKSISGAITLMGQNVALQEVVISDNHPANSANTQNFSIEYITPKSLFATANASYFQPMLQSFKFT